MTSNALETWRGEAVNWECDELGHLNMRHYVGKFAQARQMLMIYLGLGHSNHVNAHSLSVVQTLHINYKREARPGQKLFITSQIATLGETDMTIVHIMSHARGEVAATQTEHISHIYRSTGAAFGWPERARDAAQTFIAKRPEIAESRGLTDILKLPALPLSDAKSKGLMQVGTGVFQMTEIDAYGRVTAQALFGRVSECVSNFEAAWPEKYGSNPIPHHNGVLLEMKAEFHSPAAAGQGFVLYSGLKSVGPSIRRLKHTFYDVKSGTPIASLIAVNGVMDLKARKLVKTRAKDMQSLNAIVHSDL